MSRELELKYAVRHVDALRRWLDDHLPPAQSTAGWHDASVTDRYLDSPDNALAAAGYGCRLRERGGTWTVGLKSDIAVRDATHERDELEAPATRSLVPADWPSSEARDMIRRLIGDRPLLERFVLQQRRLEAEHHRPESRCLISLDEVTLYHGGRRLGEMQQLEVELLAGDPSDLEVIGRRIEASQLVDREPRSKMAIAAAIVETAALTEP